MSEDFKPGNIVELVAADGDMPWPELIGQRGVVESVSPGGADDPNMTVLFDRQDVPGVTTRKHHFKPVE